MSTNSTTPAKPQSHSNKKIRAALIDLSGTLHVGDTCIPGAIEAIQRLQHRSIPILLLTNTTKVSFHTLYKQLQDLRFTCINPETIMTSTMACRKYLQSRNLRPFCIMESTQDFEGFVPTEPPHDCVVVGLAPSNFNYQNLNQAFHILQESIVENPLIAIHKGMYFRDDNNDLSLGPGGFVACLEQASNKTAIVIGKPNAVFYQAAIQQVLSSVSDVDAVDASNVCMVGDDVVGDVIGAHNAGVGTCILVQTGKYRAGDETKIPNDCNCITVPSIVEAVDYILQHQ